MGLERLAGWLAGWPAGWLAGRMASWRRLPRDWRRALSLQPGHYQRACDTELNDDGPCPPAPHLALLYYYYYYYYH